jgi:MFS family permease
VAISSPTTAGLWSPRHRLLTTGLVLTVTLVAFEALAVVTVMPIVANELRGIGLYGWAFSSFFLGNLLGIVIVGGIIDRGGLLRPYAAGLAVFAIGLVACGLAPTMELLVAGRFLQGIGAGAIPPVAYVCIGRVLPERLRPTMFATLSTAWVVPGLAGPAIGAVIAAVAGWRYVFLGLLPLVVLAAALTIPAIIRNVPEAPPKERGPPPPARPPPPPPRAGTAGAPAPVFGV